MKYINKWYFKAIALLLVFALGFSTKEIVTLASSTTKNDAKAAKNVVDEDVNKDTDNTNSLEKDETVYVIASADGAVDKVIVSNWIKNCLDSKEIKDKSDLKDITNVKGDESYKIDSDGMQVWDSDGNDIYYSGTIEKNLPVDIKITYKLDGTEISPKDLAGKSGKLSMKFDYTNNEKKTVKIDGKDTTMYVPFAMLTGIILDNDKCSNIEVTNGKALNDGDRSFIVGYALPGLTESLDLKTSLFTIPESFEVTADVKNFELATTMTVALKDVFNDIDIKVPEDLEDSLVKLSESAGKLVDGSSKLYTGLNTLLSSSDTLISGINKLNTGAAKLDSGSKKLSSGAKDISNGAAKLSENLTSLVKGLKSANDGAKKLSDGTKSALAGVTKLDVGSKELTAGATKIEAGIDSAYAGLGKTIYADQQALNGLKQIYASMSSTAIGPSLATLIGTLDASIKGQQQVASSMASDGALKIGAVKLTKGSSSLSSGITDLKSGIGDISTNMGKLSSGINTAYTGSTKLSSGANTLATGSKKLYTSSNTLADGLTELASGINTLNNSTSKLKSGVSQLNSGAKELNAGLEKFDKEGIEKIMDIYNNNAETIIDRLNELGELSRNYKSFSGTADNMDSSVKFIYRTEGITNDK